MSIFIMPFLAPPILSLGDAETQNKFFKFFEIH